jgi:hypothetical protein
MKKLAVILVLCGICSAKKPPNPKDFTMRITVLEPGVLITVRPPCYYALDCATQGTIIQGDNVGTLVTTWRERSNA